MSIIEKEWADPKKTCHVTHETTYGTMFIKFSCPCCGTSLLKARINGGSLFLECEPCESKTQINLQQTNKEREEDASVAHTIVRYHQLEIAKSVEFFRMPSLDAEAAE